MQALWGVLAHVPGLTVVVPSTPADAGGLMLASVLHDGPVVFMEHKLLSEMYREFLGSGGRKTVSYDVPARGTRGRVPARWKPLPLGKASVLRHGEDLTMVSIGVGVHRCLQAAHELKEHHIDAGVIDLRSAAPLDTATVREEVVHSGRMLVVDEDYECCGISGELAARMLEQQIPLASARVCTRTTIPYSRAREDDTLPSTDRIVRAAERLAAR